MGEPKDPHFLDFGMFERVQTPPKQLGGTKVPKNNPQTKPWNMFKNMICINLRNVGNPKCEPFWKRWKPKMMKRCLINS